MGYTFYLNTQLETLGLCRVHGDMVSLKVIRSRGSGESPGATADRGESPQITQ